MGDRDHRHDAIIALSQNEYRDAGDAYTLAGYGRLSGLSDRGRELFDPEDAPWAGYALESFFLLRSAIVSVMVRHALAIASDKEF